MADRTFLRSIGRVNVDQGNTGYSSLIGHKLSELVKAPRMVITSLRPTNRSPTPYPFKIFKGYQGVGVFGLRDQRFGDLMVSVPSEPCHLTRQLLKMPPGALGSTVVLETRLKRVRSISGLSDLLTGVDFPIAIYSQVLDSKINTKNINGIVGRNFRGFYHNTEVEDALHEDKVCLTSNSVHSGLLVIPNSNRDNLPTFKGDQRDLFESLPGKDTRIIDYSTVETELRLDGFISLVGFSNLGNGSNCKLGGKTKLASNIVVRGLVDGKLVGAVHLKHNFCYGITRLVEAVHGVQEQLMLFRVRFKLNHQGLKHYIEEYPQRKYSYRTRLLPGLKTWVSAAEVLR